MSSWSRASVLSIAALSVAVGCESSDSPTQDPQGSSSTGSSDDGSGTSTGEPACDSVQALGAEAVLPDGRTLEEFRAAWSGAVTGGVDWDQGVDGVSVDPFGGVSPGSIEVREVSGAWRVEAPGLGGDCETEVEIESELVLLTIDGALDVVVLVSWTFDNDVWTSGAMEIPLGGASGGLESIGLPNGETAQSLQLQAVLLEPGVVGGQLFSSSLSSDALEVFGVGVLGGLRTPSSCGAFDALPSGCRAAGCSELVGTPIVVDAAGTCQCLSERPYCVSAEPSPAEPALFWHVGDGEDVTQFESDAGADAGWESCAMVEGVAACGCGVDCEG